MDENTENKHIHSKIRELRRARGLSVNKLAERMGENYQKVGRIERGKSNLTIDYLLKISNALDAPLDDIVSYENNQENLPEEEQQEILRKIILLVEENKKQLFPDGNLQKKAKLIPKILELSRKFPPSCREAFIASCIEIAGIVV